MSRIRFRNALMTGRGRSLLWSGVIIAGVGYSLLPSTNVPRQTLTYLSFAFELFSPRTWGFIWLAAAVIVFAGAWVERDQIPYGVAAAIFWAWGLFYAVAWIRYRNQHLPGSRPWVLAIIFVALGGKIVNTAGWPEGMGPHRVDLPADAGELERQRQDEGVRSSSG